MKEAYPQDFNKYETYFPFFLCIWPVMAYEVLIFLLVAVFIAKQCDFFSPQPNLLKEKYHYFTVKIIRDFHPYGHWILRTHANSMQINVCW